MAGRSIRSQVAKRGNSNSKSNMLTAGATLTPPIESSAGANHPAGQQLERIKVDNTRQAYLRLTAASVSVRPPLYNNTDTTAGLCVMVADYVRLALRNQRAAVAAHPNDLYELTNPHNTFAEPPLKMYQSRLLCRKLSEPALFLPSDLEALRQLPKGTLDW